MTPEEYEAKRQGRYERLLAAADKAERESTGLLDRAHAMADVIPFGQPILVGHHSERRDRNYRAKIESKYRRGYELSKQADELRHRAEACAANRAIFSDDPQAAERLEDRIARLEQRQERMKAANRLIRKGDKAGLLAMGFTEGEIVRLFVPDFAGRVGFADYQITNNGANTRRLKERLNHVNAHADDESSEQKIGAVRIVDSVEDNRLRVYFPGKPPEAVRADLKAHGFRWSPTAGAWQRHRGNAAAYWAKQIVNKHYPEEVKS